MDNLPSIDATPESSATLCGARECDQREIITSQASIDAGHPSASLRNIHACGSSLYSIPTEDELHVFARLPETVRTEIRETLIAFRFIASQKNISAAIRQQSVVLHLSASSLKRKWFAFQAALKTDSSTAWRTLINRAKAGADWCNYSQPTGLPKAFIEFWKQLREENQRCDSAAYRELIYLYRHRQSRDGTRRFDSIPGYSEFPAATDTGLPKGWSYENILRQARTLSTAFEKSAARQGRAAASQYRRKVFSTRVGLQVGEFILFDDQEYDLKVNFPGSMRAMRPLGLNALDLYSACCFNYGFKPTLLGEDGARQKLKEVDMLWFVVDVLTRFGFNAERGTHFVVEHGTAAIRDDFAERIARVTNGRVIIDRAGITGAAALLGQFEGRSKGNPRFKGALESFFNLVRNESAMLPGQVGLNRDRSPEQLHGMERYNDQLLRAATRLPEETAALLRFPFLAWPQFVQVMSALYQQINTRIDHELEGWGKLIASEFRHSVNSAWEPIGNFSLLSPTMQMALTAEFNTPAGSALARVRKLSPLEVFNAGAGRLQKLGHQHLPELLGLGFAYRSRKFRPDGYLVIEDQDLDSEPLRFHIDDLSQNLVGARSTRAPLVQLPSVVNVYLNPFDPTRTAILADDQNRFLGMIERDLAPCRSDLDAIHRKMGAAKAHEARLLQSMNLRHAARAQEKAELHRNNSSVFETASGTRKPRTTEERATDRAIDSALEENINLDAALEENSETGRDAFHPRPTCAASAASDIDPTQDFE
jgi:hypothetical protein